MKAELMIGKHEVTLNDLAECLNDKSVSKPWINRSDNELLIEEVYFDETIRIEKLEVANLTISFRECVFSSLDIAGLVLKNNLNFINCTFDYCSFHDVIAIRNDISLRSCTILRQLVFKKCMIKGLVLENCNLSTKVMFVDGNYGFLGIGKITSSDDFQIFGGTFKTISVYGEIPKCLIGSDQKDNNKTLIIGNLQIILPIIAKTVISVIIRGKNARLNSIDIGDLGKDSSLRFYLDTIRFLTFTNSSIQGHLAFSGIRFSRNDYESSIIIINSDLGKTQFIDCNFTQYKLIFKSSKINDIFLAGTMMPSKENIDPYDNDYKERRFILSQIKKTYETRGDVVEAAAYNAEELNTLYETLSWKSNGWEKFVILMNKISSNHGQNWRQALFATLICGMIFYIWYLNFLGISVLNSRNAAKLGSLYLEFLNPLHKSEYIPSKFGINESDVPSGALAMENIGRIFIWYFIYQLIQAFRKYGRRN